MNKIQTWKSPPLFQSLAAKSLQLTKDQFITNENLFVTCGRGLEQLLRRELHALQIGQSLRVGVGGVEVIGHCGDLCKTISLRTPRAYLNFFSTIPWQHYLHFTSKSELPKIKTCSKPSSSQVERQLSLIKTKLLASVTISMQQYLQQYGDQIHQTDLLKNSTYSHESVKLPDINILLENDGRCKIHIEASGLLGVRSWRSFNSRDRLFSGKDVKYEENENKFRKTLHKSRRSIGQVSASARILDSHAAALILRTPLLRILSTIPQDESLILWDPYCQSGNILLEALGIVLGELPTCRTHTYPFMNFPIHDGEAYKITRNALRLSPHPNWQQFKLFGCNGLFEELENNDECLENLNRFLIPFNQRLATFKQLKGDSDNTTNNVYTMADAIRKNIQFIPGIQSLDNVQQLSPKNCLIITALPYAHRTEQKIVYKNFGKFVSSRSNWKGVFVAAAVTSRFKDLSGLKWISRLTFDIGTELGGGPRVELLEWAGCEDDLVNNHSQCTLGVTPYIK